MFSEHNDSVTALSDLPAKDASDVTDLFPTIGDSTKEPSGAELISALNLTSPELPSSNSPEEFQSDREDFRGISSSGIDKDFIGKKKEKIELSGVERKVKIEIDNFGIPHINAKSDRDGIFAQGFVQAKDRLWQLEYRRRLANGNLAEVLGRDAVGFDAYVRTLNIDETAKEAYQNLEAEAKVIVDAYTAGVNSYLENNPNLPTEFTTLGYRPEPWQATDTMAIVQLSQFLIGATDGGEINRFNLLQQGISTDRIAELLPDYGADDTTILKQSEIADRDFAISPPTPEQVNAAAQIETQILTQLESVFPTVEASNSWVVSGDRTTTGKPFLANDPHLSLDNPSAWYQVDIKTPELETIGVGFPGVPGIQIGRNEDIAWGQTATQVDTQDYYVLQETEDGMGYIYKGEVRPYEMRTETIKVKDGEAITLEVKDSVYGPVVSDVFELEQPVALQAVGLQPADDLLEAFIGVNKSSNWQEFTNALEVVPNPISNFVYADKQGNIGYIAPGQYPIRQPGHTGQYPILGTGEFDWQGFIPSEDVPQAYNPESGYIVTANNKLTPDNYPYQTNGSYSEPYRAERITELIEGKDKLSLEDMKAIQLDRVSLLYRDFRPILQTLTPTSPEGTTWQQRLLHWDGNVLPNSQEASVFEAWYVELTRIPSAEVGRDFWNQPRYLQQTVTPEDAAIAFESALTRLGDDIPQWGEIHQANFTPLSEIQPEADLKVPLGGDRYTVNVSPNRSEDFNTEFGVSYRQIIDFSNLENSLYVNPPGASGVIDDPNFGNQLLLWQDGAYLPMTTEKYTTARKLRLKPKKNKS